MKLSSKEFRLKRKIPIKLCNINIIGCYKLPKTPIPKNQLLRDLYLQLLEEIANADNELVHSDQVTVIKTDHYEFELKFTKKVFRDFKLIDGG